MPAPAFPTVEVARVISATGLTKTEYATIAFLAAEVGRVGLQAVDVAASVAAAHALASAIEVTP